MSSDVDKMRNFDDMGIESYTSILSRVFILFFSSHRLVLCREI